MFEALVIIFWFLVFYLAHKLYYEYKIKMMRKKWNSIKHKQEESNDLVFDSWYNRWLLLSSKTYLFFARYDPQWVKLTKYLKLFRYLPFRYYKLYR